jgi:hypothetical protein
MLKACFKIPSERAHPGGSNVPNAWPFETIGTADYKSVAAAGTAALRNLKTRLNDGDRRDACPTKTSCHRQIHFAFVSIRVYSW